MRSLIPRLSALPLACLFLAAGISCVSSGCLPDRDPDAATAGRRTNFFQTITGEDEEAEREQWNRIFRSQTFVAGEQPAPFVKQTLSLLPRKGRVLVLAMGDGRDAVFFARHGYEVTGIDFSDEAIRRAKRLAKNHGVKLQFINADLEKYRIEPAAYDVIVDINFYRPHLFANIRDGLRPGGVVVWQSHTRQIKDPARRAMRMDNLVGPGELARAFPGFTTLYSRESEDGPQGVASLVARKPELDR